MRFFVEIARAAATTSSILIFALKVSVVVGIVLNVINQGLQAFEGASFRSRTAS